MTSSMKECLTMCVERCAPKQLCLHQDSRHICHRSQPILLYTAGKPSPSLLSDESPNRDFTVLLTTHDSTTQTTHQLLSDLLVNKHMVHNKLPVVKVIYLQWIFSFSGLIVIRLFSTYMPSLSRHVPATSAVVIKIAVASDNVMFLLISVNVKRIG